ncbi:hypothetical protein [Chryseobacterium sp. POL2]|uniref:hypothetical protein n=1 Tax=Chryseobacterium sp. POL2 TaxID=2713414 RepID=UPI0013E15268|nr:hypothetical protein [Chryseobacterium sp. POL2]QIG90348.1 hypothetical protein G6R40_12070 [Chryseobacterium sp. POL2]
MISKLTRLCIYPKDIQRITGRSERYSRALIQKIRKHYNKPEHHLVSIEEFCTYTGLEHAKVIEYIID